MGVGKTAVSQQLKKDLPNSVFLDGDWCWDADPFQVTEETQVMVIRNICYLLNSFLHCTAYENIIFSWVMHEQAIIDSITDRLDTDDCKVIKISLIERSLARIYMYSSLDNVKVDTSNKTIREIADEIIAL